MKKSFGMVAGLVTVLVLSATAGAARAAEALDAEKQKKVDAVVAQVKGWAKDPVVVAAVKAANASVSDDVKAMTQDKWKALPVLDPFVRSFAKNDAATKLKALKTDVVTEMFVSSADGKKVAFLAKTSSWSHAGKPKHDKPMAGETWQGAVEVDESSGQQQLQVAVPVLDDAGKPVGSMVVGLSVSKL